MHNDTDFRTLNLKECFNYFKSMMTTENNWPKVYQQVFSGIGLRFNLHYIIDNKYIDDPIHGFVTIQNKRFSYHDFYNEKNRRHALLLKWLEQYCVDEPLTGGHRFDDDEEEKEIEV